jgi:hypothetical protein
VKPLYLVLVMKVEAHALLIDVGDLIAFCAALFGFGYSILIPLFFGALVALKLAKLFAELEIWKHRGYLFLFAHRVWAALRAFALRCFFDSLLLVTDAPSFPASRTSIAGILAHKYAPPRLSTRCRCGRLRIAAHVIQWW